MANLDTMQPAACQPLACSIGIMAHNEAANMGRVLAALTVQQTEKTVIGEIIVVASGCTDSTESIVRDWAARDRRIRLLVQPRREGKASAVNLFLREAREEIVVLCSADLLPEPSVIEQVMVPFSDPEIGMVSSRPVPLNDKNTFMGFAAHLMWELHHYINLQGFKAGELIAFRKIFQRIPYTTAVDEACVEPVIRGQGFGVHYVPSAVVYNKGPETVQDFLKQRRRIYAGHLAVRDAVGYSVNTLSGAKILGLVVRHLDWRPRAFVRTWAVAILEVYGRFLGACDYRKKRDHSVWDIAKTTKQLADLHAPSEPIARELGIR